MPAGISGATNAATYNAPANGCFAISGTPTQAGEFQINVAFLADITAYPFGNGACTGFPANSNDNPANYPARLKILPDPAFTGLATSYCSNDPAVTLTVTGTAGGTFS